ncbi:MAG TPA: S8 family serine peptidase [Bacteroidales bacterium]|nr:S8 family serine peptidase [Bacteroidales bacterium]
MRNILVLALLMAILGLEAQIAPNTYYVQFTDKSGSPYSVDNPSAFLTQRAIQRRIRQNIPVTENDIPVNPQYLSGVAGTGATMLFPTKWLNGVTIQTTSQQVLNAIAALPYVLSIKTLTEEPLKHQIKKKLFDEAMEIFEADMSAQPKSSAGLYDYGTGLNQITQINGVPLHANGFRGEGMVIGILDGGFSGANTHIAFDSIRNNGQILGTIDFTQPGGNVYTESSHGTAVLSTIASNRPGQLIGTAPKASFWLLKSEYVLSEHLIEEYNWVSAAEFADSVGVDIINSSLGYIDFDWPQWNHDYSHMNGQTAIVTIGADIASSKGILVVNSAGNSGSNNSFPYIGAPADGFKVFSIGAVDASGIRASFSSIGPTYDGRIKPDIMAQGQGTALTGSNNSFTFGNGTSFSSPIIAGMSACLWQAKPNFTNMQIKQAIMQSGSTAGNPSNTFGYGIPDFVAAANWLTSIDTGLHDAQMMVIYPNPFDQKVQIRLNELRPLSVSVYDLFGRQILHTVLTDINKAYLTTRLESLSAGTYLLLVVGPEHHQQIKLVKTH